jgi:GNAT superfamily N-acetyltransferase
MITYGPVFDFKQGTLKDLLIRSYSDLLKSDPEHWEKEKIKWLKFDAEVYANFETIARCVTITSSDGKAAGFFSYDPRQKPLALIGHNCVVPEFRGKGIGKMQINQLLEILKQQGFSRVEAVTGEHPFFAPARKMYFKCGFSEKEITPGGPNPEYGLIRFEKTLIETA